ncbi:MAG: hypothetical protein AAGK32_10115 [Actinomycetota bacterium]
MAGTPAEYERMALKSIEKAAEDVSDTSYHLTRATIFASLANAAATEDAPKTAGSARPSPVPDDTVVNVRDEDGDGRNLPAVRAS